MLSKALLVGLVADPRQLGGCAQRLSPIIFIAMASTRWASQGCGMRRKTEENDGVLFSWGGSHFNKSKA